MLEVISYMIVGIVIFTVGFLAGYVLRSWSL